MKRPEHLDRDARILPELPAGPTLFDRAVYERGENARFAKELELQILHLVETSGCAAKHPPWRALLDRIEELEADLFKANNGWSESSTRNAELEARIEKLAHLHGEVAITTKNDGSAKKRCLRCGQRWPCDDLLILRGKTEQTYLEQLVDE